MAFSIFDVPFEVAEIDRRMNSDSATERERGLIEAVEIVRDSEKSSPRLGHKYFDPEWQRGLTALREHLDRNRISTTAPKPVDKGFIEFDPRDRGKAEALSAQVGRGGVVVVSAKLR